GRGRTAEKKRKKRKSKIKSRKRSKSKSKRKRKTGPVPTLTLYLTLALLGCPNRDAHAVQSALAPHPSGRVHPDPRFGSSPPSPGGSGHASPLVDRAPCGRLGPDWVSSGLARHRSRR